MGVNWIDLVILLVVAHFVWEGWSQGLLKLILGLLSFAGALWMTLRFHGLAADFIAQKFGMMKAWSDVLGYVVLGLVSELILSEVLILGTLLLPMQVWRSKINRFLGAVVSAVQALVVVAFILLVIVALPMRGTIKQDVKQSFIGGRLVALAQKYGGGVTSSLDRAASEAIKFLTIRPGTNESIPLPVETEGCSFKFDPETEKQMVNLVNQKRRKEDVSQLKMDDKITEVARKHSQDMFERKYFSHISPDGKDVGTRFEEGQVDFMLAGENIAFAPDLETAHEGLMNSPGHRKNILEPKFGRIGVGVADGGNCGMMFTQNFAD